AKISEGWRHTRFSAGGTCLASRGSPQYLEGRHFAALFMKRRMRFCQSPRHSMTILCLLMTSPGRFRRSVRPKIKYSL
ncbi:hypothetical protein SK128_012106, partial [Halocaridina rubra]